MEARHVHNPKVAGDGPLIMVDDSKTDVYLALRCYGRSRLRNQFVPLYSGEEFLEYMQGVLEGRTVMPSLVLLDVNMPGRSGLDVLSELRSHESFADSPPVTMLSNSDDPRDAQRSLELGADGFHTKPVQIVNYVAFFDSLAS